MFPISVSTKIVFEYLNVTGYISMPSMIRLKKIDESSVTRHSDSSGIMIAACYTDTDQAKSETSRDQGVDIVTDLTISANIVIANVSQKLIDPSPNSA